MTISYPDDGNESCFAVEPTSYWFNHRNRVITTVVGDHPPQGPVFDVGGGNGYVSLALQRAGVDAVVVEPGPSGAANARRRGLEVIEATLDDAGFEPASLRAVGLFDVVEHVEDDSAFLAEIFDVLAPGGLLYVTVPAYAALWSADDDAAGHFHRYRRRSLSAKLESAGFSVVYCSYFFCCLVPAVFVLRSVPSRLGLKRTVSAADAQREHSMPRGLPGHVLARLLDVELVRIARGKTLPTGSSCIAVARKR